MPAIDFTTLSNALQLQASGAHDGWMHVAPLGEHPYWFGPDEEKLGGHDHIIQVIDDLACTAMAATYPLSVKDGMVDREHLSITPTGSTAALGWGTRAEVRNDGVWTQCGWTHEGRAAVEGKTYKFNSPCFPRSGLVHLGGNRYRPTKLARIALTNNPNLRGQKPLTNSHPGGDHNTKTKDMEYKNTLLALLGLSATAADADITNAAAAFTADRATLANNATRITELETQLANSDLDAHNVTDAGQRALFTGLLTNSATRAEALKTLVSLKAKPAAATAIHNTATAKTPKAETLSNKGGAGEGDGEDDTDKRHLEFNAEVVSYKNSHKCSHQDAYTAIRNSWSAQGRAL